MPEIRVSRFKHYKRGQIGFAWNWNYNVSSPQEYDAGCATMDEVRMIVKQRVRKTGYPVIYEWKKEGGKFNA